MSAPIPTHDSTTLLPTHLRIDTHAYELDVEVWEKCKDPVRDGKERRGKVIVGKSIAGDFHDLGDQRVTHRGRDADV